MKKIMYLFTYTCIAYTAFAQSTMLIGNTAVQMDTLITNIDVPWEIKYTADDQLWMTERAGRVSRINTTTGTRKILLNYVDSVEQQSESGMLGFTFHPQFPDSAFIYLAYTYLNSGGAIRERISRFTYANDSLVNERRILDNIPGNSTHVGCRLLILSDKTMLVSLGDIQNQNTPQDTNKLTGKMLRMHLDGSAPGDNPFPNSLVYAIGLRNTQGIALLPNGNIITSEHGASSDDEINLLWKGRNYGWPRVEGFCNTVSEQTFCAANNIVEPLKSYTPTLAVSDLLYYDNDSFPEWDNSVLMTVLKEKELRALRLNSSFDSIISDRVYLDNKFGRLRDICEGKNKVLYLATNGASWANTDPNTHSIIRITPPRPVTPQVGIVSQPHEKMCRVFPNPAQSKIQVQTPATGVLQYELKNLLGEVLLHTTHAATTEISVEGLADGVYVLCAKDTAGNSYTAQVVIAH